jgi:HEAT repeat protein
LCSLALLVASTTSAAMAGDRFTNPALDQVPALIRDFEDSNLRFGASKAIVSIGKPAVPSLIESLRTDHVVLQIWSAYTLGEIGPDASAAALALVDGLRAEDDDLRAVAARSLGQIGSDNAKVVEALAESLTDTNARVGKWSVVSLGQIGPSAIAAGPQLVDALDQPSVRAEAIRSLVQIGAGTIPLLTEALADDTIRLEAVEALRQLDPDTAKRLKIDKPTSDDLAALEISLRDMDKDIEARVTAARWLGTLGIEAAPILITAFADDNHEVVRACSAAFGDIGVSAVPLLQDTLKHESAQVRAAAVDALAAIGADAKDAIDELISALTDADPDVRHRAVRALDTLGPAAQGAIPGLIAVMQNARDIEATRQLALKTLARIAPPMHELTIAALRESTKDKNYGVSSLAKELLKGLEADISGESN